MLGPLFHLLGPLVPDPVLVAQSLALVCDMSSCNDPDAFFFAVFTTCRQAEAFSFRAGIDTACLRERALRVLNEHPPVPRKMHARVAAKAAPAPFRDKACLRVLFYYEHAGLFKLKPSVAAVYRLDLAQFHLLFQIRKLGV